MNTNLHFFCTNRKELRQINEQFNANDTIPNVNNTNYNNLPILDINYPNPSNMNNTNNNPTNKPTKTTDNSHENNEERKLPKILPSPKYSTQILRFESLLVVANITANCMEIHIYFTEGYQQRNIEEK